MAVLVGIVVKSNIYVPLTACSAHAWRAFGEVGGGVSGGDDDDFGCVGEEVEDEKEGEEQLI